jgi:hypothetical protein
VLALLQQLEKQLLLALLLLPRRRQLRSEGPTEASSTSTPAASENEQVGETASSLLFALCGDLTSNELDLNKLLCEMSEKRREAVGEAGASRAREKEFLSLLFAPSCLCRSRQREMNPFQLSHRSPRILSIFFASPSFSSSTKREREAAS